MRRSRQSGFVLLAVLFALFLLVLALTVVAPRIAAQIKRDREEEMIRRGQQYTTAIKRFYRKFGRYPLSVEQLENTNNVRFLRRRYKDPTRPDGQWKVLHLGEAKNAPLGLFGEALTLGGGLGGSSLSTSTVGGQPQSQNPFGSGGNAPNGATSGSSSNSPFSLGSGSGKSDQNSGQGADQNSGTGAAGQGGAANQLGTSPDQLGKGQTIGGGPIIGVVSLNPAESLKNFQKKSHYNEWEFVYDPRVDMANRARQGLPQPGQQVGAPIGQPGSPFGGQGGKGNEPPNR